MVPMVPTLLAEKKMIKDIPTIASIAGIVATFVIGFLTTIFALLKDRNAREAILRKELMDENRALRVEMREMTEAVQGLKAQHETDIAVVRSNYSSVLNENISLRLTVTKLELEVTRLENQVQTLKTELESYENDARSE